MNYPAGWDRDRLFRWACLLMFVGLLLDGMGVIHL